MAGRPLKRTVEYFPHDSHASDGKTLTILEQRYGAEGYRFWFKLLERLAATPGHAIECNNPEEWSFLCAKLGVTTETGEKIITTLIELKAIDPVLALSKMFWCQNLVDRLGSVYAERRSEPPTRPVPTQPILAPDNSISPPNNSITSGEGINKLTKGINKLTEAAPLTPQPAAAETETPFSRLIKLRSHCTGKVCVGNDGDRIKEYLEEFTEETIANALRKAADAQVTHWNYVHSILTGKSGSGGNNGKKPGRNTSQVSSQAGIRSEWEQLSAKRRV